jgi:hypothetical protein
MLRRYCEIISSYVIKYPFVMIMRMSEKRVDAPPVEKALSNAFFTLKIAIICIQSRFLVEQTRDKTLFQDAIGITYLRLCCVSFSRLL